MAVVSTGSRLSRWRRKYVFIVLFLLFIGFAASHSTGLQTASKAVKKFRFVIQDNLWFTDESGSPPLDGYIREGQNMNPIQPLLGFSDSSDLKAKAQELQWLLRYTRRNGSGLVITQEWFHSDPSFRIDLLIRTVFLPLIQQHGGRVKWSIFYDPFIAIQARNLPIEPPIDFENKAVRQMWDEDLKYFKDMYFNHEKYWKIGGKPVLYIWNVPGLKNADQAFAQARKDGVYILSDVMGTGVNYSPYLDSLPPMDCATGFVVTIDKYAKAKTTIGEVIPTFKTLYEDWNREMSNRSMSFIPAGSCQYDDTEFSGITNKEPIRILAKNRSQVENFLKTARTAAKPVGDTTYVLWGTANCWAEGTTVLPTILVKQKQQFYVRRKVKGVPTRRIGNYGFAHLEAVKNTLFPDAAAYKGPVIDSEEPVIISDTDKEKRFRVRITLEDCDVTGKLSITKPAGIELVNPPDFAKLTNLIELARFRYIWDAVIAIDKERIPGGTATVKVKFKNRDNRRKTHSVTLK